MGSSVMQGVYKISTVLFILLAFVPLSWWYMFAMVLLAFSSLMLLISGSLTRPDVFGRRSLQVRARL